MASGSAKRTRPKRRRAQDWGRLSALTLCVIFALIGVVPLAAGLLFRTETVRAWAARETARILEVELGVHARYDVVVRALPLTVALENLVVDASDGGSPFLEVERVAVRPRIFSLLAGQLDVGDIEITGPRVRADIRGGELKNLRYKLPASEAKPPNAAPERPPFSSLTVTDARIDARIDDTHVVTREVDVDVTAEDGGVFEIALRAGTSALTRVHPLLGREDTEDSVDEDILCRLDTRVRVEPDSILVRRLTLQGSADFDPDPGTAPSCKLEEGDWRAVDVRLGAVRVTGISSGALQANGRVRALLPVPLAHRFAPVPYATGSVFLDVEADYDGQRALPRVTGRIEANSPGIEGKVFATHLAGDIAIAQNVVRLSKLDVDWADGKVTIGEVKVEPFAKGIPIVAGPVDIKGIEFPGLLRDLGAHPQAHVAWSLQEGRIEVFKGTIEPLALDGPLVVKTKNFEVFDKPTTDPTRGHMIGVKEGLVRGVFMVRPTGVVLSDFSIETPGSRIRTTVTLGFADMLDIQIFEGSYIDLAEISPLQALPIAGLATLKVSAHGPFTQPKITGDLAVKGFALNNFPAGDIESAKAEFEPLLLRLSAVRLKHGASRINVPLARIDFGSKTGASVIVDADVDTREAPHLAIRDLFEILLLDKDPRFTGIAGIASGTARIHFAVDGPEDRCGGGYLSVTTDMRLSEVSLFGERYDEGHADLDFIWDDQLAGDNGMRLELREGSLRKGEGSIIATGGIRHGGVIQISAIGSGIPISRLDALGPAGALFVGTASAVATVSGTTSQMRALADVRLSRIRIGQPTLPSSEIRVTMEPTGTPARAIGISRCGNTITAPFDPAEFEKDISGGQFRVSGKLFGGQIELDDVRATRQQHKVVKGGVHIRDLDLGVLANLIPGVAFTGSPPRGTLSAKLDIERLPLDQLQKADITLSINKLEVEREGQRVRLTQPSGPIWLVENSVNIPELRVEARSASGLSAVTTVLGEVRGVLTKPELDVSLMVDPIDLSRLAATFPAIERASGVVNARLRVTGSPDALSYSGSIGLRDGALRVEGSPLSLDQIDVDVAIGGGEIRLKKASARVGNGTVTASGHVPVRGLELGTAVLTIEANGVKLPVADGINLTADAHLTATYRPGESSGEGERNLPDVKGTVEITSFSYTRPIAMSVSLGQLTGRGQRTSVESYDPADDFVRFSLNVVSPRPLRFSNNLINMQLAVMDPGLVLSGTNQRFGARGLLRILPDSKLTLRTSEFEVREGYVKFDDPYRIAPTVDVRATTEYRRYAKSADTAIATEATPAGGGPPGGAGAPGGGAAPRPGSGAGAAGASVETSGQWRINLHAHGDAEDLKVSLTSDPPLGQEDIVLLLTIGMTRAEIDQGLATSLGETVGLEALSALTGADRAVKNIVPLIDEFRFGTGYSSRTGRTEPTVTVGKRITDSVRASVTTGLSENREVRSNVEWRLGRRTSVQGSYDNANDASSSLLGNIGADLRWRLEFE